MNGGRWLNYIKGVDQIVKGCINRKDLWEKIADCCFLSDRHTRFGISVG